MEGLGLSVLERADLKGEQQEFISGVVKGMIIFMCRILMRMNEVMAMKDFTKNGKHLLNCCCHSE